MSRFTLPHLIYSYHQPLNLLRVWRRPMQTSQQLPLVMERIPVAIERYAARQLLLNLQGMPPMSAEVEHWVKSGWLPRLRQSGISRLALLLPADSHNMRVLESMIWDSATSVLPYEMQYFPDLPGALDWVTNAELPTTEQNWVRSWRSPALLRGRRRRWSRAGLAE